MLPVQSPIGSRDKIIQELLPNTLGFSHEDRIGMPPGLFGEERHMRAAHDNAGAPRPETSCEIVGVIGARRMKGNADDVGPSAPVDALRFFVDVSDLPFGGARAARYGIVICWKLRNQELLTLRISSEDAVIKRSFGMALDRGCLLTFCLHRSFPPTILDETITKLTCQTCTYHPIISV